MAKVQYLGQGIIIRLPLLRHIRPPLVGVDQLAPAIRHRARAARVHKPLDARLGRRLQQVSRAHHVDSVVEIPGRGRAAHYHGRAGRVDHNVWPHGREDGSQRRGRGYVAGVVLDARAGGEPVACGVQVEDGECRWSWAWGLGRGRGRGLVLLELLNDVMAEETTPANDED